MYHLATEAEAPSSNRTVWTAVTMGGQSFPSGHDPDMLDTDMNIKKARYIARNIELTQEFHFALTESKIKVN